MKKILFILSIITLISSCKKEDETTLPAVINGCTNVDAINYDQTATNDDGSCEYEGVPSAGFVYTNSNSSNVFAPTNISFTNISNNTDIFFWDFGDGNSSDLEHPDHTFIEGGEYLVSLTSSKSDNSDTYSDTIIINAAPSKLVLVSIKINEMPLTKSDGSNWDTGLLGYEFPDVFYVLKKMNVEIASSSSQDNITILPITFEENLPYTLQDLSQNYSIELMDNDEIALGLGGEESMGSCSFTPINFSPAGGGTYPSEINISNANIDMTLELEWLP